MFVLLWVINVDPVDYNLVHIFFICLHERRTCTILFCVKGPARFKKGQDDPDDIIGLVSQTLTFSPL